MTASRVTTIIFALLLVLAETVAAQGARRLDEPVQPHPEGDAAISRLKSPFCPGLMLEVCSHPQSKILRDTIQAMAQSGISTDSLVMWMLATYGEEYRAVPQARGSGLWAWIMPPLALLCGLFVVVVVLRHLRAQQGLTPPTVEPLSEEDQVVLAEALQELKSAEEVPF